MNLYIDNIQKSYHHHLALQTIDLSLKQGVVALLGANGSGKSTLLRLLAALDYPDHGRIQWNGLDYASNLSYIRQRIGYLPQHLELPGHLTPSRLLRYLAQIRLVDTNKVDPLFTKLGMEQLAHQRLSLLSGGQLRLFGIAQALLGEPDLLLLDELTTGLDVIERERVYRILASMDRLMIFSTHIPAEVEQLAGQVIVLHRGRVLFHDTIAALKANTAPCYEITGSPENIQGITYQGIVSRVIQHHDELTVRIIGDVSALFCHPNPVEPSLEDAYLFLLSQVNNTD